MIGGLGLPRGFVSSIERAAAAPDSSSFTALAYFQWQNEFLRKTIYPMREKKLRDVLIYYMEVDVWSQYKDKDVNALPDELYEYKKAWKSNAAAALKEYTWLRNYFLKMDVRGYYSNFYPVDEEMLNEINTLHSLFVSWP